LRLLELPDALKDGLLSAITTEGHVRALQSLEDPKIIVQAYKIVLEQNLSVRGAEELARRMRSQEGMKARRTIDYEASPEVEKMENEIAASTGLEVRLSKSRSGGRLLIIYKTVEELNRLHQKLTQ
jgi:ParB family chromosome partitioning protein